MILLDSRAGSHELKVLLEKLGLPVEETTLEYGDLLFEGRGVANKPLTVAIEYKKLSDLVGSMRTGRLQGHQALGMQSYDVRWLLIEGELFYDKRGKLLRRMGSRRFLPLHGGMTISELFKRLFVLQLQLGLQWYLAPHRRDALKFIEALYRTWTDKSLDEHRSHIAVYDPPTLIPLSDERKLYMRLPHIGVKTSRLIEKRFACPLDAFIATIREWTDVGIGLKTAERIVDFLHGRNR